MTELAGGPGYPPRPLRRLIGAYQEQVSCSNVHLRADWDGGPGGRKGCISRIQSQRVEETLSLAMESEILPNAVYGLV